MGAPLRRRSVRVRPRTVSALVAVTSRLRARSTLSVLSAPSDVLGTARVMTGGVASAETLVVLVSTHCASADDASSTAQANARIRARLRLLMRRLLLHAVVAEFRVGLHLPHFAVDVLVEHLGQLVVEARDHVIFGGLHLAVHAIDL